MELIRLSKEDTLEIIKHLSRIDGYLIGNDTPEEIHNQIDYVIDVLTKKINIIEE